MTCSSMGCQRPNGCLNCSRSKVGLGKCVCGKEMLPHPRRTLHKPSTKHWVPAGAQLSLWGSACSEPTSLGLFQGHFLLPGFSGSFYSAMVFALILPSWEQLFYLQPSWLACLVQGDWQREGSEEMRGAVCYLPHSHSHTLAPFWECLPL